MDGGERVKSPPAGEPIKQAVAKLLAELARRRPRAPRELSLAELIRQFPHLRPKKP